MCHRNDNNGQLTEWEAMYCRSTWPAASYGIVALASAIAFSVLVHAIIRADVPNSMVARVIGNDREGKSSILMYATGIGFAFLSPWVSYGCCALLSIIWIVPERRLV